MMMQFKILLFAITVHIVHSEMDSTTSHESCIDPVETTSESNCFCYNEPEKDFEYSICAPTIETTITTTPKPCLVLNMPVPALTFRYPNDRYRLVQGGKCFYFETSYMNFEDARENCKKYGGKLYEPKTVVEFRDAPNMKFPGFNNNYMWIGITDTESEGSYVYDSNGKSITFNPPWYVDLSRGHKFPHGTGSNCIAINNAGNAYTFDLPCLDTYASLCEL